MCTKLQVLLLLLVASALMPTVTGAVFGIDFGSEYYKIAVISRTKTYEMVENINSKTNTYNSLAFFDNSRFFEYEAYQKSVRVPHNTFYLFNKYIGRSSDDALVEKLRKQHRDDFKLTAEADGLYFQIKDFIIPREDNQTVIPRLFGKTELRLEEVFGMILEHARELSTKHSGEEAKDVVFGIPTWWTPSERKTLLSAARLAGLNVLGMSSENTGTAIYHAATRPKGTKDQTILFVNVGTQSSKLSIFRFENVTDDKKKPRETLRLLGESWNEEFGGYNIDVCIAEDFAREFDAKFKLESILSNKRIMRRLIREATKVKEVLSANKEFPMIVEEVFEGRDFQKKYSREVIEKICEPQFQLLETAIDEVLSRSGVTPEQITDIETLGGASRIPKIHSLIKQKLGKPHAIHFNGDNSMAQGLSFLAANLSNLIRSREIYLTHGPSFDVSIHIEDPNTEGSDKYEKKSTLFKKYLNYGAKKVLNLAYERDIEITLKAVPEASPNNPAESYSITYSIAGVAAAMENLKADRYSNKKISLHFELDHLGIPRLNKGEVVADEVNDKKVKSTTYEKISITIKSESTKALYENETAFKESEQVLRAFALYDESVRKSKEAKNKLESFVYKMERLDSEPNIKKFSSPEEIEAIKLVAKEIDDWLYSKEAAKASYSTLQQKSEPFDKFFEKNQWRREENQNRALILREAHEKLDSIEVTLKDMVDSRPWVPEDERKKAVKFIQDTRNWLEEKAKAQSALSTFIDPTLTAEVIKQKAAEASKELARIRAIPKKSEAKKEEPKKQEQKKKEEPKLRIRDILNVSSIHSRASSCRRMPWKKSKRSSTWTRSRCRSRTSSSTSVSEDCHRRSR